MLDATRFPVSLRAVDGWCYLNPLVWLVLRMSAVHLQRRPGRIDNSGLCAAGTATSKGQDGLYLVPNSIVYT